MWDDAYWSWLLTAIGVIGLYFAGRKVWWAWLIGLFAQVLWLTYAVTTQQWGFIVSAGAYGWVYARNARLWWEQNHWEKSRLAEEHSHA